MTTNPTKRALTVEIFHDSDVESPCDKDGAWQLYSFSHNRHRNYRPCDAFFPNGKPDAYTQAKLHKGTAWVLSYFEHGDCVWMLSDEPKGMFGGDWQWDGVDMAGILVWENPEDELGPQSKQDRRADAAEFVETYTSWCNGATYSYVITDSDGEEVDTGGWCIGTDHLVASVLDHLTDDDEITDVQDRIAGLSVEDFRR